MADIGKNQPMQAQNAHHHSNFSNFRNYPNYFRFSIYKFILQKKKYFFPNNTTTILEKNTSPKTLQTPLPTFPISATTLIIFGFLFINLFYKKKFSILYLPNSTTKDIKRHSTLQTPQNTPNASSNFSNFRNYPNYFRFPIYKFILQKNFFYFISPEQHDERYKTPLPTFPISATTLIIFGFLFINLFYKKNFLSPEQHDERHKKLSPTMITIQLTYF